MFVACSNAIRNEWDALEDQYHTLVTVDLLTNFKFIMFGKSSFLLSNLDRHKSSLSSKIIKYVVTDDIHTMLHWRLPF